MTVLLDKPQPIADPLPDASPPEEDGGGEPIALRTASGLKFFRGIVHATLICLCFWIPVAIVGVLLLT